jgi:4-hydroxybenzoate polyprenyltransferase
MHLSKLSNNYIRTIFFGNYFYGLCVVALSIEAGLQQLHPLNSVPFYLLVFTATVLYYTKAYIPSKAINSPNPRTRWYARNKQIIVRSQWSLSIIFVILSAVYLYQHFDGIIQIPFLNGILLMIFPLIAVLYYGIDHQFFGKYNLRTIGWLKPFLIGMIWAAVATVYPIIFSGAEHQEGYYQLNLVGLFLFIKNFMFVTVLCIMFDIKDYADDSNKQIKTFVVNVGLRKTIFYIILPLSALGLASFLAYAIARDFSSMKIFMNVIPFVSLLLVAYWLHRRQSIFYYLIAIDGLMLLKGLCGSIAMLFF